MEYATPAAVQYAGDKAAMAPNEAFASGVSWAAVIGGAFAAAALSVILLALGAGLGLSSISPWSQNGLSASEFGTATIVWLIVMQIAACSMGGYLAGRLRTKWVNVHTDEVFFRDTAHGFLVWAVGLVISASLLAAAAGSMMGSAARGVGAAGTTAGLAASGEAIRNGPGLGDPNAYFVDSLFRVDSPAALSPAGNGSVSGAAAPADGSAATEVPLRAETGRIFARGLASTDFPAADKTYLAKRVAERTGMSQGDAEKRVNDVIAQARAAADDAKQVADRARAQAAHGLLWVFVSLLIGAFCASYAATIGGRQRDHIPASTAG